MIKINFKKDAYDPQIDYIKGMCILFVVWTHCFGRDELQLILFPYWGDTAVPIFLIIQAFHYYKKGVDLRMPNLLKLWNRILLPFIIMIALMFTSQYLIYHDATDWTFSPALYWDKRGPGSYYIFVYLELAFVIPLLAPIFRRLSIKWSLVVFVILSQLMELVTCIFHCPDNIYRITFFRYTFLVFIGYLLATNKIELTKVTLCWGAIGILSLYIFNYTSTDLEPLFYTSLSNWRYCHWICYLYIAFFFLAFLKYTYSKLGTHLHIRTYIGKIGKYSYEIYLFQIFYYATISIFVGKALAYITNYPIQRILFVIISTTICVVPVVYLKNKKKP